MNCPVELVWRLLPVFAGCACLFVPTPGALRSQEVQPTPSSGDAPPVRASLAPASPVMRASEELLSLQHQLRRERLKAEADRRAQEERLKELLAEGRGLDRTIASVRDQLERREKELKEKGARLKEAEEATAKLRGPTEEILTALRGYLDLVSQHMESGIPWRQAERRAAVNAARENLGGSAVTPAAALQVVGRIHQEEEALGRLVESSSLAVDLGHEQTAVQGFHLGLLAVVFANEDGSILGFSQAGQKLEDGLRAAKKDPKAAEGYMAAVDILRRRRTPAIIDLFMPSLPVRDLEAKAEASR